MAFFKQFSFIIFLFFFLNQQGFSQRDKESSLTKKYTPVQLQQDAELMKKVVLAMHPVIGIYNTRAYYTKIFDDFIKDLKDSLTEKQFRIKTKMIIDELHCGHTEALLSNKYYKEASKQKYNYSPYFFLPIKDKVYLIASLNKKKDTLMKKGAEIISINGIAVDSMLRYCKRFISTDGFNQTGKEHYIQLGFNSFYPSLFGRPDTFTVDYLSEKTLMRVKYPAIKVNIIPQLPLAKKTDSSYTHYKRAKIHYGYLDEENKTMHLKLDAFSRKRSSKAYRKIFKELKKNQTENLVLDLRNNGGGSLENCYKLLTYLLDTAQTQTLKTAIKSYPYKKYTSKPVFFKLMRFGFGLISNKNTVNDTDNFVYTINPKKKNHYRGTIYVLINGGSFSASCLVAAYLKANNKAIFIGEETSGAVEGCNAGITPFYTLPNSKIKVRIPAFRVAHDIIQKVTGHGIIPDYQIDYSILDVLSRKDLEILKAKELISKTK